MAEKLSINSDIFVVMREQFDVVLQSLVALTEGTDEGELTLKVKLNKQIQESDEFVFPKEFLTASWDITRTIKAKRHKVTGWVQDEYFIEKDEDGNTIISKAQLSLFDNKEDFLHE